MSYFNSKIMFIFKTQNRETQSSFFLSCIKENCGIILVRTATLLLLATYTPEMSPSICVEAVEKLGQFLNISKFVLEVFRSPRSCIESIA